MLLLLEGNKERDYTVKEGMDCKEQSIDCRRRSFERRMNDHHLVERIWDSHLSS